jgi:hypothetical protein
MNLYREEKPSWLKILATMAIIMLLCFAATGIVVAYLFGWWSIWD